MSQTFQALIKRAQKSPPEVVELSDRDLPDGDVTVSVEYSSLNYKDGLALSGAAPILRRFPMIPGIDLAGTVLESSCDAFSVGDRVLLNGWGVGEKHEGGFSQRARVRSSWLTELPKGLSTRQAMAIGTAGYTAMLCVMALENAGLTPDGGDVLVTGAAGGVGSIAVLLLSQLGYRVTASTGRISEREYLLELGAAEVVEREQFSAASKPLASERWAGAVDVAGGSTLATVLSQMKYGGSVAACGLAQSSQLPASVLPFILRGVSLLGVDSVMAPPSVRRKAWQRLATGFSWDKLDRVSQTVGLSELSEAASKIVSGQIRGRLVVELNPAS